jgi:glycerol-3-phosphate dehydrogenase
MTTPMPQSPSSITPREEAWEALSAGTFDVLVIGGGATGAGVARDAALRGLRTALVERDDFASGTSSRSSRLIHGGVRYLEHGHFHLVFEASRERRTLMRIAPHLVRPLAFTWPVYAGARVPRWKLGAGLLLYDALALFRNVSRHRSLTAEAVLEAEPALGRDGLLGGARYYDAATDDARLTLATALSAAELGAVVLNHAAVRGLTQEGANRGVVVRDVLGGKERQVAARVVVNAAGPWGDTIRRFDEPTATAGVVGSKGVHLAVPAARVGNRGAVTILSAVDGRVMFVLPAGGQTIVGTTDTATAASPDEVRATEEDVAYLLASVNACFPGAGLERGDVISAWAGIRPLIATDAPEQDDPGSASREHAIHTSPSGIISVSGGKLTTYRSMAAETVDVVERALGRTPVLSRTHLLPLPGADGLAARGAFDRTVAAATRATGSAATAARLARAYGERWSEVWALAERDRSLVRPLAEGLPYIGAEAAYAARHEMACTVADVVMRRTHIAFETRDAGRGAARAVAVVLGPLLDWDAGEAGRQLEEYDRDAARVFGVDPA